ncbi:hypothetical protein VTK26DRAFT_2197 [Humicola hyalothermophila]
MALAAVCIRPTPRFTAGKLVRFGISDVTNTATRPTPTLSSLSRAHFKAGRAVTQTSSFSSSKCRPVVSSKTARIRPIQHHHRTLLSTTPIKMATTSTTTSTNPSLPDPEKYMHTSGAADPVWVHKQPYSALPRFPSLTGDLSTDVCVIGAGIAGIHVAYEQVVRGKRVTMLEARDVLAGESGRTSGHLTNDLDDGYVQIAKKHGEAGAKAAAESHAWARERVGEIAEKLGIDCEYRKLRAYDVSQYAHNRVGGNVEAWKAEMEELRQEAEMQRKMGIETSFDVSSHLGPVFRGVAGG